MAVYTPATEAFTVSILGESTKQTWAGEFRIKTKLSWRDQMQMDKARRELLGPDPQGATPDTIAQAVILAELGSRIVESPAWWSESRGGLDFYDSDVITGIYEKVRKIVLAEEKDVEAEGEQARKDLKAVKESAEKVTVPKGNRKPLPTE